MQLAAEPGLDNHVTRVYAHCAGLFLNKWHWHNTGAHPKFHAATFRQLAGGEDRRAMGWLTGIVLERHP